MRPVLLVAILGAWLGACGGASGTRPMAANASSAEVAGCQHLGQIKNNIMPPGQPDRLRMMNSGERTTMLREKANGQGATHIVLEASGSDPNNMGSAQMYKCAPGAGPPDAGPDGA